MSIGSSWQLFSKATPPERGSFPLDIKGECSAVAKEYMDCLKSNHNDHTPCRDLAQLYLQCRMDKKLMEKDEMSNLGFEKSDQSER